MAVEAGDAQTENSESSIREAAAELGNKLRKLREAQGLTFEDVRSAIKIQIKYIEAKTVWKEKTESAKRRS